MEQAFGIVEQYREGSVVVAVSGEVDVATAPALREHFEAMAGADDARSVVVDLTGVPFIDSTGLGVLIGVRKRCEDDGHPLSIVIVEPRILKVFEITGLTELFSIHPSLDAALTA